MKNKITTLILLTFTLFSCVSQKNIQTENWIIKNPNGFDYYVTTEIKNDEITGYSRKKALKDILGTFKFLVTKATTSIKKPEIVNFEGVLNGNKFNGQHQMIFKKKNFEGAINEDSLIITIKNKNGSKTKYKGTKIDKIKPQKNYREIVNKIFKTTEENIYNQAFVNSNDWKRFKTKMLKLSKNINDDLELQIAFTAFAREFPFSHYYLYKKNEQNQQSRNNQINLKEIDKETCLLEVKSFMGSKSEMSKYLSEIDNKNYKNLIIDLRNNSGGNYLAAFPLVEYIIDKPIISGVFPNKNWYKEFNRLPNKNDYSKFTEFSGGTLEEWFDKASKNYGAYFKMVPSEKHFTGNVYILTNKNTASTCEPLIYGLKNNNFATIVGENTAGSMLSSNEFNIDNDIVLRIPLNDYVTYSGNRIDKKGVKPNIEINSKEALDYVIKTIKHN